MRGSSPVPLPANTNLRLTTLATNTRAYILLFSCALAQKLKRGIPLTRVSAMATNDAIFIAKKRLEYFLKCNLLGYPLEAVEEDCCSSCSPHNVAYETPQQKHIQMPHGAFQLLRVKNRYSTSLVPCALASHVFPPQLFRAESPWRLS